MTSPHSFGQRRMSASEAELRKKMRALVNVLRQRPGRGMPDTWGYCNAAQVIEEILSGDFDPLHDDVER